MIHLLSELAQHAALGIQIAHDSGSQWWRIPVAFGQLLDSVKNN